MAKRKTIADRNEELAAEGKTLKLYAMKLRLEPTPQQFEYFQKAIGCARFTYNFYLREKKEVYQHTLQNLPYETFKKSFIQLKTHPVFSFLAEVDKFVLESAMEHVDVAYENFFKGRAKYPKFKKKHAAVQSFTTKMTNNNIKIDVENQTVQLPKVGKIRFRMNKKQRKELLAKGMNGVIKNATVTRHSSGSFHISLQFEEIVLLHKKPDISTIPMDEIIGADLGLLHFAILSSGEKIANPRYYQKKLKQLGKMQKRLSRMVKGSENYRKQAKKIAKLHLHIKNMRHDFLHKVSRRLVNENQVIILEDLNVKGMIHNKKLAKSIQDVGWGYFKTYVSYKAEWAGKHVVFIDRFFPSSKLCNGCNEKNTLLSLSEREWVCPSCGTKHDRDVNAAENIKKEGIRLLQSATPAVV